MKVDGRWPGGAAERMWPAHPRDTTGTSDVRRVLAEWREAHGWEPGMRWNPYTGTYEHPQAPAGRVPIRSARPAGEPPHVAGAAAMVAHQP